jgi:hypothetical protein
VFGGLAAILGDIAPDSNAGVGAIALGFAVALGAIAWLLAPALREPDDGDIDGDGDGDTPPLEPASPDVV